MYKVQLIAEAVVVGVILVIVWVMLRQLLPVGDLTALFILGALTHVGFEAAGANKWYCKNGHACLN